ncbi:MAG: hypothetical protein ACETVZ_02445 [Phycisphaerae bacterium]
MGGSSRKISSGQILIGVLAVMVVFWVGGCGDFFASKPAGLQSQAIIDDLSRIETPPEPNIPLPEIYKQPPQIVEQVVGGTPEFKLFYFCKYHPSDELKQIVHDQFATKLFDKKGKETKLVDYTVSSNPATNQLIARCPAREDVEAVLELLQQVDVPPIQVKINCLVSELYADKTLDWETTLAIQDLLGEDIRLQPGGLPFGTDVQQLINEAGEVLPSFPGASLREVARARMGLKVGYLSTSHEFTALVDLLESQGYLKIVMNPTLEVVNGKKATVLKSEHVPLQKITKIVPGTGGTTAIHEETEYVDVVDSLEITPHVFADGTIGLETSIVLGSKLTPEGVKQLPIVTKKEIENQENRIRRGESLIIGGIRKSERRDVVRGIPGLKDIPIVGILFSGRDFEERVIETIFVLTPTISTGGIPNQEMVKDIRRKHETPGSEALNEAITDPFGLKARERQQKQKMLEAEEARLEAEAEKAEARSAIRQANEKIKKAEAEIEKLKAEVEEAQTETEKAKKEAEQVKEEAEKPTAGKAQAKANPRAKNPKSETNKPKAEKPEQEPGKKQTQSDKKTDTPKAKQEEQAGKTEADDEA